MEGPSICTHFTWKDESIVTIHLTEVNDLSETLDKDTYDEIVSISDNFKDSLENERRKASEEKGSTTDSSNEEDEENRDEMLLNYRDRRLRRWRANRYDNILVNPKYKRREQLMES